MLEPSRTDDLSPAEARRVVMVVDDDNEIREALADVLADRGYAVIEACDGQQALERLATERRPDAILFDLWMPVMDGWQLLQALLDDPSLSHIPRVILTAARGQKAKELNVVEVLTKPVRLEQMLGLVERLTARR
jgi:CheY-like chemotaxis protein